MVNKWDIPDWLERKVRNRDKFCVYCKVRLKEHPYGHKATFEHIDNNGLPTEDNIAMCCFSCNASKGTEKLLDWLGSPHCKRKKINEKTVARIVKKYISSIS